jgi:hypothetical protein
MRMHWLCVVAVAACSTNASIERSWRAPDARVGELTSVVTLFPIRNGAIRRAVEDRLARQLVDRGMRAVPSYSILRPKDLHERDVAAAELRQAGFDGVVAMRVIEAAHAVDYVASFDAYWGNAWTTTVPESLVRMQIDAYALADRRLVWSGLSRTVDAQDLEQLVDAVTQLASEELESQQLIAGYPRGAKPID